VFSIGALLYRIVCGRAPFWAPSAVESIELARRGVVSSPSELLGPGAVPYGLERIIVRALAPRRDDRYPSILALQHELTGFMRCGGDLPRLELPAGTHVITEGELGTAAYIIAAGRCEIYRILDGHRVTIRVIGPGAVFGETAILSPGPRLASVVTLEDTSLWVVSGDSLEAELERTRPWLGNLIRTLAERFRELERQRSV
jgi:hypothetical protein